MKLRTSFFNFGVLRKNLTRFAPLWILYAIAEVLGIMTLDLGEAAYRMADDLSYVMGPVSIFHAVYALLVAACLFGDLFDSRLCNGLHAMPMRREGWLLTNLVSGLIFALIPALAGGAVGAFLLREYWWVAVAWQLTSLLQFLFFFGVAVFSAMCAGKRLGMIAVYAILNLLSMLILWVATMIYEPLLPGVVLSDDWYSLFCPLVTIFSDSYCEFIITYAENATKVVFEGYTPESWYYLFICVGVGAVFTVLAWLLYKKRHLETAGDFISFRPMRLFFLLAYTLAAGVLLYSFGELLGIYTDYGFLVVGILIGWFTGWMLLERTIKIFTKKVLIGLAIFGVLFAGSIGITIMDPLGVASYVPQTEQFTNVCLYPMQESYIYTSTAYFEGGWYITDPAEIAEVQDLHAQMIEAHGTQNGEIINMELRYELKNGMHVYRSYDVPAESPVADDLRLFLSDPRAVFGVNDWQQVKELADSASVFLQGDGKDDVEITDPQQLQMLIAAIEADCEAGLFAQHDYFHPGQDYVGSVHIPWQALKTTKRGPVSRNANLVVYADCVNTAAFLKTLEKN